jgi:hypothetical protein
MVFKKLFGSFLLLFSLASSNPLFTKINAQFEKSFVFRNESLEKILNVDRDMNLSFDMRIFEYNNLILDGSFLERTIFVKDGKHIWNTPYTQEFYFSLGAGIKKDLFEGTVDYTHYCLHYLDPFSGEVSSRISWQFTFNSSDYGFKRKNDWRIFFGKYMSKTNFEKDYVVHGDFKLYSGNFYISPSLDLSFNDRKMEREEKMEVGYKFGSWFNLFFKVDRKDPGEIVKKIGFQAKLN